MTETLTPPAGTARAAAVRLRSALDAHLDAVEARTGEHDPAVQQAFKELREAAREYDDALYAEHDEVTPFDLPELELATEDDEAEGDEIGRLSLLARWDFSLDDVDLLISTANKALGQEIPDASVALAALAVSIGHTKLGDPAIAQSAGLRAHGATTWVVATDDADPDDDDPGWMDDAFAGADPDVVLCRLDAAVEHVES
jgi:hypothetical protein